MEGFSVGPDFEAAREVIADGGGREHFVKGCFVCWECVGVDLSGAVVVKNECRLIYLQLVK
jgi:hypothetical protein